MTRRRTGGIPAVSRLHPVDVLIAAEEARRGQERRIVAALVDANARDDADRADLLDALGLDAAL